MGDEPEDPPDLPPLRQHARTPEEAYGKGRLVREVFHLHRPFLDRGELPGRDPAIAVAAAHEVYGVLDPRGGL